MKLSTLKSSRQAEPASVASPWTIMTDGSVHAFRVHVLVVRRVRTVDEMLDVVDGHFGAGCFKKRSTAVVSGRSIRFHPRAQI